MRELSWETITLGQFQAVHRIQNDAGLDEMDKVQQTIGVLYGLNELEVDQLSIVQFKHMAAEVVRVTGAKVPGKPVKRICVNGRRYAINYEVSNLTQRQYVEIMHFSGELIPNMHKVMASLVRPLSPVKRRLLYPKTWFRWKETPNKSSQHAGISEDMQDAKLMDVYQACLFFCKVYSSSISAIKPYLIKEMTKEGKMTPDLAEESLTLSQSVMDGFILHER